MSSIHNIAFLVGRGIVGGFFLMNGFNHFAQLNMMAGYAKSKGVPAPALAVGGSGVLLFLGGLSLLLGYHPTIGVGLLVIFLRASRSASIISGRFKTHKQSSGR